MTESEFIASIDCCFPYDKPRRWRRICATAPRVSSNAAFMVVHEVCRVPRPDIMNEKRAKMILDHLYARFRHPAKRVIAPAVKAYLKGERLRAGTAVALMRRLAPYTGEYNALGLCYFCTNGPAYDALETAYQAVLASWSRKTASKDEA